MKTKGVCTYPNLNLATLLARRFNPLDNKNFQTKGPSSCWSPTWARINLLRSESSWCWWEHFFPFFDPSECNLNDYFPLQGLFWACIQKLLLCFTRSCVDSGKPSSKSISMPRYLFGTIWGRGLGLIVHDNDRSSWSHRNTLWCRVRVMVKDRVRVEVRARARVTD